jgi:hypothetical protein
MNPEGNADFFRNTRCLVAVRGVEKPPGCLESVKLRGIIHGTGICHFQCLACWLLRVQLSLKETN